MAVELFSGFADFKLYTGGRINTSMELDSLGSTICETARRHIVPWLGQTYFDLVSASSPSAEQVALMPYVKRPLAILTMYEWSKVGGIQVGDAGLHRVETDSRKAAFRYQEKAYQEDAREKGYDALEDMLLYISSKPTQHADWHDSEEGKAHLGLLLNYAKQVRLYTSHVIDRYSYEALRPIIRAVQEFTVQAALPRAFWEELIGAVNANLLSDKGRTLVRLMRTAIAYRAIEEAKTQHLVEVKGGRVAVREEFIEQSQYNLGAPPASLLNTNTRDGLWSDRYACSWKEWLNPTDFPSAFDVASGGTNTDADAWHVPSQSDAIASGRVVHELQSGGAVMA